MQSRISFIIQHFGLKKSAFADSLSLSPAMVSMMCSGEKAPSARTKADICRIYGVNPDWLETGEGDPFKPKPFGEQIGAIVREASTADPDQAVCFFHRLIDGMSEAEILLLYQIFRSHFPENKKED